MIVQRILLASVCVVMDLLVLLIAVFPSTFENGYRGYGHWMDAYLLWVWFGGRIVALLPSVLLPRNVTLFAIALIFIAVCLLPYSILQTIIGLTYFNDHPRLPLWESAGSILYVFTMLKNDWLFSKVLAEIPGHYLGWLTMSFASSIITRYAVKPGTDPFMIEMHERLSKNSEDI